MAAEKAIFLQVCVPSTSHEVVLNFSTYVAIRFVLGDAYTTMSREERQALLHEGVSVTSTLSAYGSFQPFFVVYVLKIPSGDCLHQPASKIPDCKPNSYHPTNYRVEEG